MRYWEEKSPSSVLGPGTVFKWRWVTLVSFWGLQHKELRLHSELDAASSGSTDDATEWAGKTQVSLCTLSWGLCRVILWGGSAENLGALFFPVSEVDTSTILVTIWCGSFCRCWVDCSTSLLGLMVPSAVQVLHFLIDLLSGCFTHYWKSTQLSFEILKCSTIITGVSISPFESDHIFFYILTQHRLVCYKPLFPEFWQTWFGYFRLISQYFWGETEAGSCLVHHFEHGSPKVTFWHSSHQRRTHTKKEKKKREKFLFFFFCLSQGYLQIWT